MAEKFELKGFQKLLRRAIGNRSQAEFASITGISAPTFSRMLSSPEIARPKISTLKTIAGAAQGGITLQEFMLACGYDAETVQDAMEENKGAEWEKRKSMTISERSKRGVYDLKEGIEGLTKDGDFVCKDLFDFFDTLTMIYGVETYSFQVEHSGEIESDRFAQAEEASIINFSFCDTEFSTESALVLYYFRTKKNKTHVLGAAFDFKSLYDMGSRLAWEVEETEWEQNLNELEVLYRTTDKQIRKKLDDKLAARSFTERVQGIMNTKGVSQKEAFMIAILGDPDAPKRICSSEGIGFYTDDIKDSRIRSFLNKHKTTFCRTPEEKAILNKVNDGADFDDVFDGYPMDSGYAGEEHWATAVANIIYRETDIRLSFWQADEKDKLDNRSCLMFKQTAPWLYNETEKELKRETLEQILSRYAMELGTEINTDCWYLMYMDK